ncbi:MAG: hypothetical protein J6I64_02190, partial [Lachnospiraceae bacterium]|nr:hypothetical protein [Lachnospiraceae bacterium]
MMEGIIEKWIALTFIVAIVCVIRSLVRGKIRPGVIYGLWGLAVLRLLWPAAAALPESRYSIQNLQVSQKISAEYEQVQEEWFQNVVLPDVGQEPEQVAAGNGKRPVVDNASAGDQNASQNVGQNAGDQSVGVQSPGTQNAEVPNTNIEGVNTQNANSGEASQPGTMIQQSAAGPLQQSQTIKSQSNVQILPVWGWIWLAGSVIMAAGMLLSQWRFYRQLKKERTLWTTADQLCDLVETSLPVYIWEGASSPFLYGIRPAIYVPKAFTEDEQTLDYILLHEWCHYRHGDHIWAMIRVICLILYWHHPMVWVASALSRSDCEMACDDSVRIHLGEKQRLAYAGTLLTILEAEVRRERFGYMTTSMSGGGKEAARRMTMLWERRPGKVLTVVVACIALLGLGCTTFTTTTSAEGEAGSSLEVDLPEGSGQDGATNLLEGPGSSAEDPIPVEPGMRLYEGLYYSSEIDQAPGAEVFCYLGTEKGNPRFEINGLTITNAVAKVGTPVCETVDGVKREVYYLMDLRADDGRREFTIVSEDETGVMHTFFYKYQHSWIGM